MKTREDVIKKRQWLQDYKVAEGCEFCGYNNCPNALHLHHRNPEEKKYAPAGLPTRSWTIMQREVTKCAVLCATHHAEVHAGWLDLDRWRVSRHFQ